MLCMSKVQGCPDPAAFQRACVQLFKTEGNIHGPSGIDLDKVCLGSRAQPDGACVGWG